MARWIRDEELSQPQDFVQFMMEDYLKKNGFKEKKHKGELVWQNGDGFLVMARFIRYEYSEGKLHLEAWVGKHRENALKGFAGTLPKKVFKGSLEELLGLLHQTLPQDGGTDHVVTVQVADHGKLAVPSLIISIVGVVVSFFIPLPGIVIGGVGIAMGQKASNSARNQIARVAVILGVIAVLVGLVSYVLHIAMVFSHL